jgi:antitoxin component of MazEF toxin-antitoxin module
VSNNALWMQVQKWGLSVALRIPKPFAEDADVESGDTLT